MDEGVGRVEETGRGRGGIEVPGRALASLVTGPKVREAIATPCLEISVRS